MEASFRVLMVVGLLAALLPAAAAIFSPQPGWPSELTLLDSQVALFCAADMPTVRCCELVVAAVHLGGGVLCRVPVGLGGGLLCRFAAEPQLVMAGFNASHLLTLYTACHGLRTGGAHLAARCEGPAPSPPVDESPPPPLQQHGGAAHSKALAIYKSRSRVARGPLCVLVVWMVLVIGVAACIFLKGASSPAVPTGASSPASLPAAPTRIAEPDAPRMPSASSSPASLPAAATGIAEPDAPRMPSTSSDAGTDAEPMLPVELRRRSGRLAKQPKISYMETL